MFLKLTPNEISDKWVEIKYTLVRTLPPAVPMTEDVLNNLFEAALVDKLQVWALRDVTNGKSELKAICTTMIQEESTTKVKTLLLFSLYGMSQINTDLWVDALGVARKYAKQNSCKYITAYSDAKEAIQLAARLGGDVSFRYIILEV